MSELPKFNFMKPSAAAPVTSMDQAEACTSPIREAGGEQLPFKRHARSQSVEVDPLSEAPETDASVLDIPEEGGSLKEAIEVTGTEKPAGMEEGVQSMVPNEQDAPKENLESVKSLDIDNGSNPSGNEGFKLENESNEVEETQVAESSSAQERSEASHSKGGFDFGDFQSKLADKEPAPGALRKHSIAAMKELGTPEADEENVFDYARFMECLRAKSADPIARYIKSFLQEFSRGNWTPEQQEKIVSDFMRFISFKMRDFEPFVSMSKRERRNALEGVEKLIMTRLYTRTFSPQMPPLLRTDAHNEDLLRDQLFDERLRLWSWVEGRHLDINHDYISHETRQSNFIELAERELKRLPQFKSPRDKMICILNCSKVIFALIRQAHLEQNADSFLPLLIYVVLKAEPEHLVSTINYIQRFRNREFQRGETAYYLSTIASAVAFLEKLDKTSLTISDEEFEEKMTESVKRETDRVLQERQVHEITHSEGESSAAVITTSANMLVDRMKQLTTRLWEDLGEENSANTVVRDSVIERRQTYRREAQAAERASLTEYESALSQQKEFEATLSSLQSMFPALERDLVEDVLRQSNSNIGSAVDMCLALSA